MHVGWAIARDSEKKEKADWGQTPSRPQAGQWGARTIHLALADSKSDIETFTKVLLVAILCSVSA